MSISDHVVSASDVIRDGTRNNRVDVKFIENVLWFAPPSLQTFFSGYVRWEDTIIVIMVVIPCLEGHHVDFFESFYHPTTEVSALSAISASYLHCNSRF